MENPKYENIKGVFIKMGVMKIPLRIQEMCVSDIGSTYIYIS